MRPSRRDLLRGATATGLVGACHHRRRPIDRVVVVGAGLAGLCCALQLHRRGWICPVFEARDQVGGRVRTQRDEGVVVDVGATRILANHDRVHEYTDLFGLRRVPWLRRGEILDVVGDRQVVVGQDWPVGLTDPEADALARGGLSARYLGPARQRIGDPLEPGWPPEALADLDAHSRTGYLRSVGASEAAIAVLNHGHLRGWVDRLGILQSARYGVVNDLVGPATRIEGGNDRLARAFARALTGSVHLSSAVRQIRIESDGSATVSIERAGLLSTVEADAVVLAVPLPALNRIEIRGDPRRPARRSARSPTSR